MKGGSVPEDTSGWNGSPSAKLQDLIQPEFRGDIVQTANWEATYGQLKACYVRGASWFNNTIFSQLSKLEQFSEQFDTLCDNAQAWHYAPG